MLSLILFLSFFHSFFLSEDLGPCLRTTWPDDSLLSPVHLAMLLLQFQLFCLRLWIPDLFTRSATCPRPAVFNSLETAGAVEILRMIGYEKPTDIYSWGADLLHPRQLLWLLLFDPAGHLMNIWTSWPCSVIVSTRHSQKRTGHSSYSGSSLGFFLGSGLPREFFPFHRASTPASLAVWGFRAGFLYSTLRNQLMQEGLYKHLIWFKISIAQVNSRVTDFEILIVWSFQREHHGLVDPLFEELTLTWNHKTKKVLETLQRLNLGPLTTPDTSK